LLQEQTPAAAIQSLLEFAPTIWKPRATKLAVPAALKNAGGITDFVKAEFLQLDSITGRTLKFPLFIAIFATLRAKRAQSCAYILMT